MSNKKGIPILPSSWQSVRLGDFVENDKGKKPKNQSKEKTDEYCMPYVDIKAFEKGIYASYTDGMGCRLCSEEDFLMVWDGSRSGLVGKGVKGAIGSTLVRINFPRIVNNYAYYFLQSKYLEINTRAKGVGIPHVDPNLLWGYEFPIPPFKEQHRIVSTVEELFSEIDKGVESLKTAKAQLQVYRQSLLKHAFEGKLTEQWRKDNPDKVTPAAELLEQIKQAREQRYQQQLSDWKQAVKLWQDGGKEGKKPIKPPKISDICLDLGVNVKIPNTWIIIKYGDICEVVRNGISIKPKGDKGAKIFRISAVRALFFNMSDYRFIDNSDGALDRYFLRKGDIVFTRYNGSRRYVGVCAEYQSDENRLFPDKLIQTRLMVNNINSSYAEKALNSGVSRKFIESKIRTTAGQSGVSGSDVKNIPLPICSKDEQIVILQILDMNLSLIDKNEEGILISLKQAKVLKQSILKKAFSGQLVEQDPNDEPASELLERIQAEKLALAAAAKLAKASTKKRATKSA